jgi:hypothetical protein
LRGRINAFFFASPNRALVLVFDHPGFGSHLRQLSCRSLAVAVNPLARASRGEGGGHGSAVCSIATRGVRTFVLAVVKGRWTRTLDAYGRLRGSSSVIPARSAGATAPGQQRGAGGTPGVVDSSRSTSATRKPWQPAFAPRSPQ